MCILCLLLVVFLCVTDWLGFSLIRGNPLPQSVQTWIRKHPESTICGEVVRCQENEETQSVYLKNTYLIYNSEKVSIDNVKVYLQQKKYNTDKKDNHNKLLAGSLVFVSGKLEEIESPRNPGEFDSKQYYACQHIYYVMKKGKIKKQSQNHSAYGQFLINMRQRFAEILEKTCGAEAGAFEAAFATFGYVFEAFCHLEEFLRVVVTLYQFDRVFKFHGIYKTGNFMDSFAIFFFRVDVWVVVEYCDVEIF